MKSKNGRNKYAMFLQVAAVVAFLVGLLLHGAGHANGDNSTRELWLLEGWIRITTPHAYYLALGIGFISKALLAFASAASLGFLAVTSRSYLRYVWLIAAIPLTALFLSHAGYAVGIFFQGAAAENSIYQWYLFTKSIGVDIDTLALKLSILLTFFVFVQSFYKGEKAKRQGQQEAQAVADGKSYKARLARLIRGHETAAPIIAEKGEEAAARK